MPRRPRPDTSGMRRETPAGGAADALRLRDQRSAVVIEAVCREFGRTPAQILAARPGGREYTLPRQIAAYLIVRQGLTVRQAAATLKRHPSAIGDACRRVARMVTVCERLARLLAQLPEHAGETRPPLPPPTLPWHPRPQRGGAAEGAGASELRGRIGRLRRRGWSARGIAQYLGLDEREVARQLGIGAEER